MLLWYLMNPTYNVHVQQLKNNNTDCTSRLNHRPLNSLATVCLTNHIDHTIESCTILKWQLAVFWRTGSLWCGSLGMSCVSASTGSWITNTVIWYVIHTVMIKFHCDFEFLLLSQNQMSVGLSSHPLHDGGYSQGIFCTIIRVCILKRHNIKSFHMQTIWCNAQCFSAAWVGLL